MEVEAAAGAILVFDSNNPEVSGVHRNESTVWIIFGSCVADGYVELYRDACSLDACIFAGVEECVSVWTGDDTIVFFLIGIHTNTSFLKCNPTAYAVEHGR